MLKFPELARFQTVQILGFLNLHITNTDTSNVDFVT
jgi:hypothetical protein